MKYRNLSHSVDVIKTNLYKLLGKTNLISAYWWGIKTGKGVVFIGKCHFKRFPGSKISIGGNCKFYSKPFSNQIGINRHCMVSSQTKEAIIEIGDNCGFSGTVIGGFKHIRIGNNVRCGANTLITDSDWHNEDYRSGETLAVYIEDNVWLGEGVKVLKGVRIGENSIIGAGSIVRKNIPANVVAAGYPCIVVKKINENKGI
jgi:acetyltransferase-like isoleucine patch superfamily enzyme